MVVQGSKCIGNVESMMAGVKSGVKKLVHVHTPVQKVLPGIDDENGNDELDERNHDPINGRCHKLLPGSEGLSWVWTS